MEFGHIVLIVGFTAAVCNFIQYSMKTMIPLRVMAIVSNILFVGYGTMAGIYPTLVLHTVLLPLNFFRLREMRQLIRRVEHARASDLDMKWLHPFMMRRSVSAGETLFRKGDVADAMYLVTSGAFHLPETGIALSPGAVVGELGFLAPDGLRTQSLVCDKSGEILVLSYERFEELYFQNPEFGLAFLKLTSRRLFQNIARLENELARRGPVSKELAADPTMT